MTLEEAIEKRIEDLIERSHDLVIPTYGDPDDPKIIMIYNECHAWIVSAQNITQQISKGSTTPYTDHVNRIAETDHAWTVDRAVGQIAQLLKYLLDDVNAGLVKSIFEQARTETYDDFLEHAEMYLSEGKKNEAGVIAGVVFEDTIRRLCRKSDIEEKGGTKLDKLISSLQKNGTLSSNQAKRARVAAGVRNNATHAQWDEFEKGEVNETIVFTRELLSSKLHG